MFPFSGPGVLDRLAQGFKVAGARAFSGYLPLHLTNRLSGPEIQSLLFGKEIEGVNLDRAQDQSWGQRRTAGGVVEHFGHPIQPGVSRGDTGVGRIEDDRLCEQWSELTKSYEICVVVFRVPERNARIRWGDYVMVTDMGPNPFRLVE